MKLYKIDQKVILRLEKRKIKVVTTFLNTNNIEKKKNWTQLHLHSRVRTEPFWIHKKVNTWQAWAFNNKTIKNSLIKISKIYFIISSNSNSCFRTIWQSLKTRCIITNSTNKHFILTKTCSIRINILYKTNSLAK